MKSKMLILFGLLCFISASVLADSTVTSPPAKEESLAKTALSVAPKPDQSDQEQSQAPPKNEEKRRTEQSVDCSEGTGYGNTLVTNGFY